MTLDRPFDFTDGQMFFTDQVDLANVFDDSSVLLSQELAQVKSAVNGVTRKQLAIVYKWADGVSTPTPPGHWNFIAYPCIASANFSEMRTAGTFALLNMAMHDAAVATWDTKFAYFNPRPSQLDPGIRTVIGLPNVPSYISGHSTFPAAAAEVLSYVFPSGSVFFRAQRDEAGISRLYGGIHYPTDIDVGKLVGERVAGYTIQAVRVDGADD